MRVTQADMEAARKFIADEWPSWDDESQTVSAQLMVLLSNYRIAALEEAAKVADGHAEHAAKLMAPGDDEITDMRLCFQMTSEQIATAIRGLKGDTNV